MRLLPLLAVMLSGCESEEPKAERGKSTAILNKLVHDLKKEGATEKSPYSEGGSSISNFDTSSCIPETIRFN